MLDSAALWGDVCLGGLELERPGAALSLAWWLGRRRAGLRRLWLDFAESDASPVALLLEGACSGGGGSDGEEGASSSGGGAGWGECPLRDVALIRNPGLYPAALAPLARCPQLTRLNLRDCSLAECHRAIPSVLSALTPLRSLDLSWCPLLDRGGFGTLWRPLRALTNLTQLDAANCALRNIPQGLPALERLNLQVGPAGGREGGRDCKGGAATSSGAPAQLWFCLASATRRPLPLHWCRATASWGRSWAPR